MVMAGEAAPLLAALELEVSCPGQLPACVRDLVQTRIVDRLPAAVPLRAVFFAKVGPFPQGP